MHHIYHTEAFILKSYNIRESDKIFYLYTKDFGLISAIAQGVRKIESKLRFSLQDYSYIQVDLIHNQNKWRITSALSVSRFSALRKNKKSYQIIYNISQLLLRLIKGEEKQNFIFQDLSDALSFIDRVEIIPSEQKTLEVSLVIRILHNLGYIKTSEEAALCLEYPFNPGQIKYTPVQEKKLLVEINQAMRESQL